MQADRSAELNLTRALKRIRQAVRRGAQIICLQELFKTSYFPQTRTRDHFEQAEVIPGPTTELFAQLAVELGVVIIVPIFERSPLTPTFPPKRRSEGEEGYRYHNTAAVIDADGALLGTYRKQRLPNDPCFYEKFYFEPGDCEPTSFATRFGRIGVLICWDQWFPEPARAAALSGADILFYPSAIGWLAGESRKTQLEEQAAWEMIQRSHAIANGIYVAAVNRVGREGRLTFWGRSFVAGPFGEVIARASGTREEILIAHCDLSRIHEVRKNWPFLAECRKDVDHHFASKE